MYEMELEIIERKGKTLTPPCRMPPTFSFCCAFLVFSTFLVCVARDTINVNSILDETKGETLVSAREKFELGFFTPNGSSSNHSYLGIWYYNLQPITVVWVANRDNPISDSAGIFAISDDGNLKVLNKSGSPYWSTGLELPKNAYRDVVAKLLDSGNLVLRYINQSESFLWQSFDNPVDTFLPGMKLNDQLSLNSWTSLSDPRQGNFSFKEDDEMKNAFVILNGHIPNWRSGGSDEFDSKVDEVPCQIYNFQYNITNQVSRSCKFFPTSTDWRIVLNSTGEVQFWILDMKQMQWLLNWRAPRDNCSKINVCGNFGICNSNDEELCKCLPGFNPSFREKWSQRDFSDGCKRNMSICGSSKEFLKLKIMKIGKYDSSFPGNSTECRDACLNSCQCQAYSYTPGKNSMQRGNPSINSTCWIWTNDPKNLQEDYSDSEGVHELFVPVAISTMESMSRSCAFCGTNLIPYPLSTGSNCGDSMYSGFYCNNSIGMIQFEAPTGTYNVTRINQDTRTFFIQVQEADSCNDYNRNSMANIIQINQTLSLAFRLVNFECESKNEKFFSYKIEISWKPPPEPTCNSSEDCKDWPHSTCNVTDNGTRRCICNANFTWDPLAINCTQDSEGDHKQSEGSSGNNKKLPLIVGITLACVVVLSSSILCLWLWKRKMAIGKAGRRAIGRKEAIAYHTEKHIKDLIDAKDLTEEDQKRIDVQFFNLRSILTATDNFSEANKLGQGGFGSVYKGTLPEGQEVAIKRLSSVSVQGLEEFKNEVLLIAKLQHRNLVRLLGYCLKGDEKILVYEYMPNKSLDFLIFDSKLCDLLNWEMRFNIILGIARGLLYLHQDSRLRIVHRDLKTSNILLDEEMNPKISDFGLARIVEGKMIEGSTNRVVGTFGYMSPEYAIHGLFSVKSDVFSFGVVMLEILSGRKNTAYFNLLAYSWKFWREDKALELLDETLRESCNIREFSKCVNVALLCVQEDPVDRPTMSTVVVYLSSEIDTYPTPKQPAFFTRVNLPATSSTSSSKQETIIDLAASSGD